MKLKELTEAVVKAVPEIEEYVRKGKIIGYAPITLEDVLKWLETMLVLGEPPIIYVDTSGVIVFYSNGTHTHTHWYGKVGVRQTPL